MSEPLTYSSYLQLGKILQAQDPESSKDGGKLIHDEHLFIITHQAFELWFKQVLHDINSVCEILKNETQIKCIYTRIGYVENNSLVIIQRLGRVEMIMKMVPEHFRILETMTSMDFMDFREYLKTGSGFESHQFRMLENRLGLKEEKRIDYNKENYKKVFKKEEEHKSLQDSQVDTLFQCVERWLERMDNINDKWEQYKKAVDRWIDDTVPITNEESKGKNEAQKASFRTIFEASEHNDIVGKGERLFSHGAYKSIVVINQHRHEPEFQQAFQILNLLMNVDELIMRWRAIHITMVQRMIGNKAGTGGSSGYSYLRSTFSDKYKVFLDLFNMAAYMIPSKYITDSRAQNEMEH